MCPFVSSFPSPLALLRSRLRSKWRRTGTSQSRESLACSRLSHSVRTFSISRTRLSRSLEQAFRGSAERRKWSVKIMENRHLLGLYVLCPFSGQVMFFRQFAFCLASPVGEKWMRDEQTPKDVCGEATFCPFINYAYICAYLKEIWKKQFSGVTSRGMKWVNKPYKLKRPIKRLRVRNWSWTLLGLLKYSQTSLIRTPKGQNQVSTLQRCPNYRCRERSHFWHFEDQTNCPYFRGVRKERLDCML